MTNISSLSSLVYIRQTQAQKPEAAQCAGDCGGSAFMLQLTQAKQSLIGGNGAAAGDIITADPLVGDSLSGNSINTRGSMFELLLMRFGETPQEAAPANGLQGIFQQIDQLLTGLKNQFQQDNISDNVQKSPLDLQALFDQQRQHQRPADPVAEILSV